MFYELWVGNGKSGGNMYPRNGLGFSGDFRLLMPTKGDDNCGSLAPPRGQYHMYVCMYSMCVCLYIFFLGLFYLFSLFPCADIKKIRVGCWMEGFYRGDFGKVGFLRGFWVVNEREAGGLHS